MRTSILMNAGFVIGTGDYQRAGPRLVHLQRRPHEHVQPQHQHSQDAGEVPGPLGRRKRVRRRGPPTLLDIVATHHLAGVAARRRDGQIVANDRSDHRPLRTARFLPVSTSSVTAPRRKRSSILAAQAKFDARLQRRRNSRAGCDVFLQRFFANQFKRSCLPDGPKVGTISLSPRGDWRMPSDAAATLWLEQLGSRE